MIVQPDLVIRRRRDPVITSPTLGYFADVGESRLARSRSCRAR
jgi:hypothetical protein